MSPISVTPPQNTYPLKLALSKHSIHPFVPSIALCGTALSSSAAAARKYTSPYFMLNMTSVSDPLNTLSSSSILDASTLPIFVYDHELVP